VIIRNVVTAGLVDGGVLAGLAEPRLSRAQTAMHEAPGRSWSLENLADAAGMSRTRFADYFRSVVGRSPIDYLTLWRMTVARKHLAKGRSVKAVAAEVGYDSAAAFSRVFSRVIGQSLREWQSDRGSTN
jgi:transcriptional regulator GlxA family with amidase domain